MKITNRYLKIVQVLLFLTATNQVAASDSVTTFDITGPTANDVDNISPTVLNFDVAEKGNISSLSIRLSIDATGNGGDAYWDNMFVQISHAGIDVVLMDLQGDNASRVSSLVATFSDGGGDLASALMIDGPTVGTFSPLQSLSAFNGVPLEGAWKVTLRDDTVPFDGTDFTAVSLIGKAAYEPPQTPEPTPVPAISIWGLGILAGILGLIGMRRRMK